MTEFLAQRLKIYITNKENNENKEANDTKKDCRKKDLHLKINSNVWKQLNLKIKNEPIREK